MTAFSMTPQRDLQWGGFDWSRPTTDLRYNWASYSALPTGVVCKDAYTGGSDRTVGFEGLNGGRMYIQLPGSSGAVFLRFDDWALADPDAFHRVIFEIEGIQFPANSSSNFVFSLRDRANSSQNTSGLLTNARTDSATKPVIQFNAGGSSTAVSINFDPADMARNLPHTIGVGYELLKDGTKYILLTYNGAVYYRAIAATLDLTSAVYPYLQATKTNAGTLNVYSRGARLRLWRYI